MIYNTQTIECNQATQSLQLKMTEDDKERELNKDKVRERLEDKENTLQQLRRLYNYYVSV